MNSDPTRSNEASRDARGSYWDSYYAAAAAPTRRLPSQFAAFVAGELHEAYRIIDVGCGTGRDAMFFAGFGHEVVGIDASSTTVEACRRLARDQGSDASFVVSNIDTPGLAARVRGDRTPRLVYARFFLHAITDPEEVSFLDFAAEVTEVGDLVAVEYRTIRDYSGAKTTADHFRRYILPASFDARALSRGFEVTYAVEGFGFAKHREDDAYVARTIFRRYQV